jgi:hypothetical protein
MCGVLRRRCSIRMRRSGINEDSHGLGIDFISGNDFTKSMLMAKLPPVRHGLVCSASAQWRLTIAQF